MHELTINLSVKGTQPLYEQIYEYIRNEIEEGRLSEREKLPSARILSSHLGVSRSTINLAYMQLMDEGYIYSEACKGYYVNDIGLLYTQKNILHIESFSRTSKLTQAYEFDFSPHGLALESVPMTVLQKIRKEVIDQVDQHIFERGSSQGELLLREAISEYLFESRGMRCIPEQIIISSGSDILFFLLKLLLGDNIHLGIENPTYPQIRSMARNFGYRVSDVKSDEYGMDPINLESQEIDVAYVMPSHQFPTGKIMPIKRRQQLIDWAVQKNERYLIEDDYDSEFRYTGRPLPTLWSYDGHHKVIYMGTFSKSIAPAIKIGYMVLPLNLIERYWQLEGVISCSVERIHQLVMAEFIKRGHFIRHLNQMRRQYKLRHDTLIGICKSWNIPHQVSGDNAGLHIILKIEGVDDQALASKCKLRGLRVYSLQEYTHGEIKADKGLVIGFGGLDKQRIETGMELLKECILEMGTYEYSNHNRCEL